MTRRRREPEIGVGGGFMGGQRNQGRSNLEKSGCNAKKKGGAKTSKKRGKQEKKGKSVLIQNLKSKKTRGT